MEAAQNREAFRRDPHCLPEGWTWQYQDEVFTFQGGTQPPKSTFLSEPIDGCVRLIQIRDYESDANAVYVADSRKLNKCTSRDVMIARYGASLGRICRGIDGAYNVALVKAIPRASISNDFLYYLLKTTYFQVPLLGQGARSAQSGFNRSSIKDIILPIPPKPEQRSIAAILGALDDKIASNHRLLVLQDEWIRASFDSLSGEVIALGSLASVMREQREPSELPSGTVYLGLEHLPRRLMWASDLGTTAEVTSAKSTFARNDVLFGKLRPYFHKVVSAGSDGVCSTDIIVLRAIDSRLAGFVLAACASDDAVRACVASSDGTQMPRTSWNDLAAVSVRWPGEMHAQNFSSRVLAMSNHAHALIEQSRRLALARDELLPLLLSGRIRVLDAEKVVEGVV